MTCAIVSAPRDQRNFLTTNFSGLICDVLHGADRIYLLSFVNGRSRNEQFIDPIDGGLLIELQFFPDEAAARRWVARDMACRGER